MPSRIRIGWDSKSAKYDAGRPLYIDPLIYSTYLGGSGSDYGHGIAVDSAGNAYVTGYTDSTDFPTTPGAFQTTATAAARRRLRDQAQPHGIGFGLLHLSGRQQLRWRLGIAVDSTGNAYVTGRTLTQPTFPSRPAPSRRPCGGGESDAFVTKINPTGSALVYSTYLGGSS